MKLSVACILIFSIISFSSCSSDVSRQDNTSVSKSQSQPQSKFPAKIAENQSIVTAEIEGIYVKDKNDFFIKARILKVYDNPLSLSFAIQGASYILIPSFQLDDKKHVMASDKNKSLSNLTKLKAGETFKAVIFYEQFKGWFIEKVL